MGYETKAIIVKANKGASTTSFVKDTLWRMMYNEEIENSGVVHRKYAEVLGVVNLCKLGTGNNVPKNETEYYFYKDDGSTPVIEDNYGDKLRQMSLVDTINFFKNQKEYRRVDILLSLLDQISLSFKNEEIFVLFYGY